MAALAVCLALGGVLAGCSSGPGPTGAAAPAEVADSAAGTASTRAAPAWTGTASGAAADSPEAAAAVLVAYFTEINAASRAGRVADVADLAEPGCQTCALDVAVTRDLQQRGLRADTNPYAISAVSASTREGVSVAVTFRAVTTAVGLLDPAGRRVDELAGAPARLGTAQLALTAAGWVLRQLRYSAGVS